MIINNINVPLAHFSSAAVPSPPGRHPRINNELSGAHFIGRIMFVSLSCRGEKYIPSRTGNICQEIFFCSGPSESSTRFCLLLADSAIGGLGFHSVPLHSHHGAGGERRARLNGPTLAAQIETQTSFFTAPPNGLCGLTWEECAHPF